MVGIVLACWISARRQMIRELCPAGALHKLQQPPWMPGGERDVSGIVAPILYLANSGVGSHAGDPGEVWKALGLVFHALGLWHG